MYKFLFQNIFKIFFWTVLYLSYSKTHAQNFNPVEIKGLSTGSIYDLLADSKGFIWVAHETGISRYDGNRFTDFQSIEQTNMAMTDLLEDQQGRVWCHNFNGQLFYIEKGSMTLLKAYDNSIEKSFQRTIILDDELLATSDKGLFVCNTRTLQCHYEKFRSNEISNATKTIALLGDKAVVGGDNWFIYQKKSGLSLLKTPKEINISTLRLQPIRTKDTLYAIENPIGKFAVYKLLLRGDSIQIAGKIYHTNKENTVTQDGDKIYINTNTITESTDGRVIIRNYDLSDIVTDRQGNRWYSSLQRGLLFENRSSKWEKFSIPELVKGDYVRSLSSTQNSLICGTNNGYIFCKNITTGKTYIQKQITGQIQSIQTMYRLTKNSLIILASIGFLLFDTETGDLEIISNHGTVKKIAVTDSLFMIACSDSLTAFPITPTLKKLLYPDTLINVKQTAREGREMILREFTLGRKRCKSVCYDKEKKIAYASFIDGLYSWENGKFQLLKYEGNTAHSISMVESLNKVFFSSIQGIFHLSNNTVLPLTKINERKSDVAAFLKAYKQYLFLIEKDELQVFNIENETLLSTISLPDNYNGLIYSVEMIDNTLYLANPSGLYKLNFSSLQNLADSAPVNYLLSVIGGNRNITYEKKPTLKPSENNLTFTFSAPGYVFPTHTFFNYQLLGSNDTTWHKMSEAEFSLTLASLKPGSYTLNAYAVDYRKQKAVKPISFQFTIDKPWWQQTWFVALSFLALSSTLYFSILYRFKLVRKRTREKALRQQQFDKQLIQSQIAVQEQERKRIAEDLHDDIGATLSALHLHISTLPEAVLDESPEIKNFYERSLLLTSKAANDVRDISHDLLPKDFSELGLFAVLQNRINELNATNAIELTFITDGNEKQLDNIYSITIYRIVNELITNIIKHSQAREACIQILITNSEAQIIAEDNGIGINTELTKRGIGMKNIQSRIDFLKGQMHLESSDKGTVIIISIPTPKKDLRN